MRGTLVAAISLCAALSLGAAGEAAGPKDVVGSWRVYSATLYLDSGGGGQNQPLSSRRLELRAGGSWQLGSSAGRWAVAPVKAADWKRWGVDPYGPKRKIVLSGWAGGRADGPIEESTRVDFIWVIYRAKPPAVSAPGTVWLKFGRVNP